MRTFDVVCLDDPAIDTARMERDAPGSITRFVEDRDPKHLLFHDGEQATVFHCRVLTRDQLHTCSGLPASQRLEHAFRCGVVGVDGLRRMDEGTASYRTPDPMKPLPMVDLETAFAWDDIAQVADVIFAQSVVSPKKGLSFRHQDTYWHAIVTADRRRAAARQTASSSAESSAAPDPSVNTSSP